MWRVAERLGVEFHFDAKVDRLAFSGKRASGVEVGGVRHDADAVG